VQGHFQPSVLEVTTGAFWLRLTRGSILVSSKALFLIAILYCAVNLPAQMLDPAIDRDDEPFSYFSQPTDVIGVMDAPAATLVTPEGYLFTGFGELMFFTGDPPVPVQQRVKTLLRGYLPLIEYGLKKQGVSYRFTMFAATLDGTPGGTMVNFVRVKVRNEGVAPVTAHFSAAVRYQNEVNNPVALGDNRFARPATAKRPGEYEQPGENFDPAWEYGFEGNAWLRGGKVLYVFPNDPKPSLRPTLKESYNEDVSLYTRPLYVLPTTPVGIAHYTLPLAPAEERVLEFKMPYVPMDQKSSEFYRLLSAHFDSYLEQTVRFWDDVFAHGIDISVPEAKVVNTFKANLIYDLIARDKIGDDYVQMGNSFQYHAFWLRDSALIARMYDVSGYHEFARQAVDFFAKWQQPDGNFVSQGGQFDGWGQTIWIYGQHYLITHDLAFAEKVYPSVQKAVAWLQQARSTDPLHLIPVTAPGDNENITGHVTGHNFWALIGLKNAIALADALGRKKDARDWRSQYADFYATLMKVLNRVTASTGGYIPPGLEGEHGEDWGNMLAIYPELLLDPKDPKVTATLKATRDKYQEGIMTYGDGKWLHHYLTMENTETEVIRGDQQMAIEELYALLLHTSSTHAGFEFAIWPWSTRDFATNLAPHGTFAAKFRILLRDMLVREQGNDLHLLSCVSPEWMKAGATIDVHRADTVFGQINFDLQVLEVGRARIKLDNQWDHVPDRIVLHLPWFLPVPSVSVDGKNAALKDGAIVLPITAKEVELRWVVPGEALPRLNYENSVADYRAEYKRRYEEFLRTGK
jgi:hypothetical protein